MWSTGYWLLMETVCSTGNWWYEEKYISHCWIEAASWIPSFSWRELLKSDQSSPLASSSAYPEVNWARSNNNSVNHNNPKTFTARKAYQQGWNGSLGRWGRGVNWDGSINKTQIAIAQLGYPWIRLRFRFLISKLLIFVLLIKNFFLGHIWVENTFLIWGLTSMNYFNLHFSVGKWNKDCTFEGFVLFF